VDAPGGATASWTIPHASTCSTARGVREIYGLEFFDQRQAWLDVRALLRER